jgi:methionyl aminopeptidase
MIKKSPDQIEKMACAGRLLAQVIAELGNAVKPGVTLRELDEQAHRSMVLRGAVPSFLDYKGFPASICASPNEMIVHGIPDDRALKDGDIFSADFGLILDGWHADSACTFEVGEISQEAGELLRVTRAALDAGIERCWPGNRVGDISNAIQTVVERAGFSVVRQFVGHGVGRSLHEDPPVPNCGRPGRGPILAGGRLGSGDRADGQRRRR